MRPFIFAFVAAAAIAVLASPASSDRYGHLFGTDANGGNLITIDQSTGAGTVVGPTSSGVVPALAVDPITGVMYAGQGAGSPNLYTVDPITGSATLVGDTGLGVAAIVDLDSTSDGTLFASVNIVGDGGTGSDHLPTIDKSTAAATVIGPFGTCGPDSCSIDGWRESPSTQREPWGSTQHTWNRWNAGPLHDRYVDRCGHVCHTDSGLFGNTSVGRRCQPPVHL